MPCPHFFYSPLLFFNEKIAIATPSINLKSLLSSMATITQALLLVFLASLILLLLQGVNAITFTITNNCEFTIWPATLTGAGHPPLENTGFTLDPGFTVYLPAPPTWSGRIWARTHCSTDPTGKFSCLSGDCASGSISCSGAGGIPPATLAEFTLDGADGNDFYDTSLVDGFNLPLSILPDVAGCSATGCASDVNRLCPVVLQQIADDGEVIGCKSPCLVFQTDQYCCTGEYNDPHICTATDYSRVFKDACPRAYSYPYDDATSTFTCVGANYLITFCPVDGIVS